MIRGTKRQLQPNPTKIEVNLDARIHNRFDIEVIDSITGELKQMAFAENVVCNNLWTKLFAPANYFNYIHFGTGSGVPSATDASLFTYTGSKAVIAENYDTTHFSEGYISSRKRIQLTESEYVGSNLSEVGIAFEYGSTSLCTHAMLKDMNGNTITIAKTATDIINIYATVFVHWNLDGWDSGHIKFDPLKGRNCLRWFLGDYTAYTGTQPLYGNVFTSGEPHGTFSTAASTTASMFTSPCGSAGVSKTFDIPNKKITLTSTRIAAGEGNIGGLRSFAVCDTKSVNDSDGAVFPCIKCRVGGSWYAGTQITGEAIGTGDGATKDFELDFQYVHSGVKIYIDGVETTAFTVDMDKPTKINNMGIYFQVYSTTASNNTVSVVVGLDKFSGCTPDYNQTTIYYNPNYALGINSYWSTQSGLTVSVSDDLVTWASLGTSSGTITVPAEHRTKRYWKIENFASGSSLQDFKTTGITVKHLHFTDAPASGAVITGDYFTETIAKDVNHVLDASMVITFAEKTT